MQVALAVTTAVTRFGRSTQVTVVVDRCPRYLTGLTSQVDCGSAGSDRAFAHARHRRRLGAATALDRRCWIAGSLQRPRVRYRQVAVDVDAIDVAAVGRRGARAGLRVTAFQRDGHAPDALAVGALRAHADGARTSALRQSVHAARASVVVGQFLLVRFVGAWRGVDAPVDAQRPLPPLQQLGVRIAFQVDHVARYAARDALRADRDLGFAFAGFHAYVPPCFQRPAILFFFFFFASLDLLSRVQLHRLLFLILFIRVFIITFTVHLI